MKIVTEYIGEIEYTNEDVIYMEKGLYGFEDIHEYLLIDNPEPGMPYMWLQSLSPKKTYFIVTNPFYFVASYDFDLSETVVERLSLEKIEDVEVLAIVVIPENVKNTTMNLQSPIVLNRKIQRAEQVILEEEFPLRYQLFQKGAK